MTPLKLTRIGICRDCPHRKAEPGDRWPHCTHTGGPFELNDDAFDGPDSDCPANLWAGANTMEALAQLRSGVCQSCSHMVMKAGFKRPRCRWPGRDEKLTDDVLSGRDTCPSGLWAKLGSPSLPTTPVDKTAQLAAITARNVIVTEVNRRKHLCAKCADTECEVKKCSACARTKILADMNRSCPLSPPQWGPAVESIQRPDPPPDRIRVVWTISCWNEPLITETVRELYDSIVDPHIDFDVLVLDDGSDNGCCKGLTCPMLHNPNPLGIGAGLNKLADYAIEKMEADVVGVADPHMKVPKGAVEALAYRALEERCVTSSAAFGWAENSKTKQWGAYLVWKKIDAVFSKWMGTKWPYHPDTKLYHPDEEWAQVQVPLGAFYAYSKETVELLKGPTGRLWETVVGKWGFLLEPFSIKCHLMYVPVYVSRDVYTRHLYKHSNPVPRAHVEKIYNGAFGFASVLSEETFEKRLHEWHRTRGDIHKPKVEEMIAAGRKGVKRPWSPQDEQEYLDSLPVLDGEGGNAEKNPIPLDKIMLRPPRDKLVRKETGLQKLSARG